MGGGNSNKRIIGDNFCSRTTMHNANNNMEKRGQKKKTES